MEKGVPAFYGKRQRPCRSPTQFCGAHKKHRNFRIVTCRQKRQLESSAFRFHGKSRQDKVKLDGKSARSLAQLVRIRLGNRAKPAKISPPAV